MTEQRQFLELGYISGVFGVKGWLKIYSYTRPAENICSYQNFFLEDYQTLVKFAELKQSGKHVIGRLEQVSSREQAEVWCGRRLFVDKANLPRLDGEFYWADLLGLSVVSTTGEVLGTVAEMLETGANDVLVVRPRESGVDDILIPFVMQQFVLAVDLDAQQITVDWTVE